MKKILSLLIMVMIITISIVSYATVTVTTNLSADKTTLKVGDEVTFTFSINSVTDIEGGLKTIQGTIVYDQNIFEELTTSSKVDTNGWSTELNTQNNMFAGTSSGKTSGGIFTLTLKAKEDITVDSTTVTIKDIKTTDAGNDDEIVNVDSVQVVLNKSNVTGDDDKEENETNQNTIGTTNTTDDEITSTTNKINNNSTSKNSTTSVTNSLPKTGISYCVIIASFILVIVAIISIIKYKYYNKI